MRSGPVLFACHASAAVAAIAACAGFIHIPCPFIGQALKLEADHFRPICLVQPMAFMTISAKCAFGRLVNFGKENFLFVQVSSWYTTSRVCS